LFGATHLVVVKAQLDFSTLLENKNSGYCLDRLPDAVLKNSFVSSIHGIKLLIFASNN
jgi:hypothetical protein